MTLTMEDAARMCGLPKLPTPLISREPCERCADAGTETDTGAFTCKASASGIPECESYRAVRELEDMACQVAALYKRIGDSRMRAAYAYGTAGSYADGLWEQGLGAVFNEAAFMDLCGCAMGTDR